MIERAYNLGKLIKPGKVLVLYGARRVGKTTIRPERGMKKRRVKIRNNWLPRQPAPALGSPCEPMADRQSPLTPRLRSQEVTRV
jgi:hypothetical protein